MERRADSRQGSRPVIVIFMVGEFTLDSPKVLPLLSGPNDPLAGQLLLELLRTGSGFAIHALIMLRLDRRQALADQVLPDIVDYARD
jgi:hypothetical protein